MSHPVWRRASLAACVTVFLLGLLMAVRPLSSNPGPTIAMSVSASPASVAVSGLVSYSIALSNSEDERTSNLQVVTTLPAGFTYVPGSTVLSFNGIASWWHDQQPFVSGSVLTWNQAAVPDFTVPLKREGNYYGIHTFVQDHFTTDKYDKQLNQARELGGPGAFVTQLLYPVTPQTMSARSEWRDFVQRTCNKGLTPIIRLATEFKGSYWEKPSLDGALAQAFGRVVADVRSVLPAACTLYVQVLNETNLTIEWSGEWPDPIAYGQFLVQAAQAIRSQTANDSRIKILNGALSPGGNYNNVTYTWDMLGVPGALEAWDAWATHPYPANHPAGYNIHAGTAYYPELTIDSYILELQQISRRGRHVFDVLATETGYRLTDSTYQFEGYPPINDVLRAGYIRDAFQNNSGGAYGTWTNWPEFRAATPYELSDPARNWWQFDWIDASDRPYLQYTYVRDIPYKPGFEPDGTLTITFQARVGYNTGMQTMNVSATADNASIAPASTTVYVSPAVHTPTATRTHTPTPTTAPGQPTPTTTATSQATPTATASATVTATPSASPTPILCTPSLLGSFSLPDRPKGLAVDAATHRLHVGLFDSSRLAIYDTQSHSLIGEVNTGGLHSYGVAVDQASGTVYVANRGSLAAPRLALR